MSEVPPSPCCISLEASHYLCTVHAPGVGSQGPLPEGRNPHEINAQGICLFSLFIHAIMIYVSIYSWLFYTLDYSPVVHYLFCCLNWSSVGLWEFFQAGSMSLSFTHFVCGCVCACVRVCGPAHSLTFCHWEMLQTHVYFLPRLESAISPWGSGSFSWRGY